MSQIRSSICWVLVLALATGCSGGIRLRSNAMGAAVKKDGESAVIARVPGEFALPADKPHTLTFSAPGYQDGTATLTPRCSYGLATALIVGDILTVPLVLGAIGLVLHSIRIATDPYYPGVYDEEELYVELKPLDGTAPTATRPSTAAPAPTQVKNAEASATRPTATPRFCTSCGSPFDKSTTFCTGCGAKQ